MLRPFLTSLLLALAGLLPAFAESPADYASQAKALTAERQRPSLFVTATKSDSLRSIGEVRAGIKTGHAKALWEALLAKVDRDQFGLIIQWIFKVRKLLHPI